MRKIAVIFESSPFDRKGLFNAVHSRTKHLSAAGVFEVDAYCMHIRDSFLSRRLRKTSKVQKVRSVEVESIRYKMLWRRFSYLDEFRRRFSIAPKKLLAYAASLARFFRIMISWLHILMRQDWWHTRRISGSECHIR